MSSQNFSHLQDFEMAALHFASDNAGQFLESKNQSDLAKLSRDDWLYLCMLIALSYYFKRIELQPCPF